MLVIGFVVYFWATPKEGMSKNDLAASNIARMEAKINNKVSGKKSSKVDSSRFLSELVKTQDRQKKYLSIFAMLFGVVALGYSFLKKEQ